MTYEKIVVILKYVLNNFVIIIEKVLKDDLDDLNWREVNAA